MLMSLSGASICHIKLGLIPHQRHAPAPCVAVGTGLGWVMLIIISITSVTAQTIQPGECSVVELGTKVREVFTITENAPNDRQNTV